MTESSQSPPPPTPIKIGGLSISRRALLGTLVVLLYVAGAAFVVGYTNRSPWGTDPASPTNTQPAPVNRCWDGVELTRGKRCSTDFDGKTLFWAFNLDPAKVPCERAKEYDWSDVGFSCRYLDDDLRMAIWRTADWRDQRLAEYGEPKKVGKGLLLHQPGSAERYLLRYDSDDVLLYASVKAKDGELLEKLLPEVKSRTEMLYGAKVVAK